MANRKSIMARLLARFGDSSLKGLVLRLTVIAVIQIGVLALMVMLVQSAIIECPMEDLLLVFGVILACQMAGQVVSERPRGNDWIWFRMVASIGTRTAFPLLFIIASDLFAERGFMERTLIFLMVFYFVGLVLSSIQTVLKNRQSDTKLSQNSASPN